MDWILNRGELSELLGVSYNTVEDYRRRGLPVVSRQAKGRGAGWEVDARAAVKWLRAQLEDRVNQPESATDAEALKNRKLAAQAHMAELDLAERLGEIIPIADVEKAVTNEFLKVKSKFLSLPVVAAPLVAQEDAPSRCQDILTDLVLEALNEFARDVDEAVPDEAAADEGGASSAQDGKGKPRRAADLDSED